MTRLIVSDKPAANWQAEGALIPQAQFDMQWQDDDGNPIPLKDVSDELWRTFFGYERPAWAK